MSFLCKQPKAQLALCGQAAEVGSPISAAPPPLVYFILFFQRCCQRGLALFQDFDALLCIPQGAQVTFRGGAYSWAKLSVSFCLEMGEERRNSKLQNKSGHEPAFLAGLKKSRSACTLAFMHTPKKAPPHTHTHRPVGTHICTYMSTYMLILNKHMHMSGESGVYSVPDSMLCLIYHVTHFSGCPSGHM